MQFIKKSFSNKNWLIYPHNTDDISKISRLYNLHPIISKILYNRQISIQNIAAFTSPKIKNLMPNPYTLYNLKEGVDILIEHIKKKSNILILSDYDVDGITSLTLFSKYLDLCNINFSSYIPNRFTEGYGLNANSIKYVLQHKPNLLILLDNGSSSYNEIELLRKNFIDVIIIDHHTLEINTPKANAIINPKNLIDTSNLQYLCSVGLVFLYLVALNNCLLEQKIINNKIDLLQFLDLVALGTIADMVPLIELNRAYANIGLKLLQKKSNIGICSLIELLNLDKPIDYETVGFYIAPLINAGARMGNSNISYNLLNCNNVMQANILANSLIELNKQRQEQEDITINQAVINITNGNYNNNNLILVGDKNWSSGTIGIIAGRLKEIYNKPACVYSINNNIATASGRSVDSIDLGEIILGAKLKGLLISGGGHSQAVGFSFNLNNLQQIETYFNLQVSKKQKDTVTESKLLIDDVIAINSVNVNLCYMLQNLSPFGVNFAEPLFLLNKVQLKQIKQIGTNNNHISCLISDGFKYNLKGIAFKAIPGKLGEKLLTLNNQFVDLVVSIKLNIYQGKEYVNLIIKDLAID